MTLLDLVINNIRRPPGKPSFNVLLTLEHLHLIPRRQEVHRLEVTGEDLPVNALGFTDMLLVKSEVELEAVKSEGAGKIPRAVACEEWRRSNVAGSNPVSEHLLTQRISC